MRRRAVLKSLFLFACLALFSTASVLPFQAPPAPSKPAETKPPAKDSADDQEVVKLQSAIVTVYFNVIDHQNHYVTDLKKENIRVLEDGKEEEIFSFGREINLPLTFAILIDTSGSQEYSLDASRAAATRFLHKVIRPETDLAAIISFEGYGELRQKLTNNLERLERALRDVSGTPAAAQASGTPGINPDSRAGGTAIYDVLYATASDELSREAGRRVIVLLTDGDDTVSRLKDRDAIQKALHEEIQIYAIGIEGRGSLPGGGMFRTPVNRGVLNKICKETGGRGFYPKNDAELDRAFQQIEEDLREQYVLTYPPSNSKRDGSFRLIKIEARNQAKVTVRHRAGYYAPREKS